MNVTAICQAGSRPAHARSAAPLDNRSRDDAVCGVAESWRGATRLFRAIDRLGRERRLVAVSALAAVLLVGTGCSPVSCKAYAVASLVVTVQDASGNRICDATVTVRDGDFTSQLAAFPGTECTYSGPSERKGTYSLEVRSGTTTRTVDSIKVSADQCHVIPRQITISLDR